MEELSGRELLDTRLLKKFRTRSLSNPNYRDAKFLDLHLRRRRGSWQNWELRDIAESGQKHVREYQRFKSLGDLRSSESEWSAALSDVDRLVARVEEINGEGLWEPK